MSSAGGRHAPAGIAIHGAYARLTLERLERGLGGELAAAVIERALELAHAHRIPEEPRGYAVFVCGALYDALSEAGDEASAQAFVDDLGEFFERPGQSGKPSEIRRRSRPAPRHAIVLGTRRPERAKLIEDALIARHDVYVVGDAFALARAIEEHLDRRLVVVADDSMPSLRGAMLATIARYLPRTARFVFLGDAPDDLSELPLPYDILESEASLDAIVDCCDTENETEIPPALAPMTVVLADPDDVWRTTFAARLTAEGYSVVACSDGFAALDACLAQDPALVLIDLAMPALNGPELAQLLEARSGEEGPSVVFLGGEGAPAQEAGSPVLPKDSEFGALLAAIRGRTAADGGS